MGALSSFLELDKIGLGFGFLRVFEGGNGAAPRSQTAQTMRIRGPRDRLGSEGRRIRSRVRFS